MMLTVHLAAASAADFPHACLEVPTALPPACTTAA